MKMRGTRIAALGLAAAVLFPAVAWASAVETGICGFVYVDANDDGIKDPGEAPIPGVTITLDGESIFGPVNAVQMTGPDGGYCFLDLLPGTYTVTETQPPDYLDGKDTQGTPGTGTTENDRFFLIVLPDSLKGENNNFGELLPGPEPASLGDYVWLDVDEDGIQDEDETGFAGVRVNLYKCDGTLLDSMDTGPDGKYLFTDLEPGDYYVEFVPPAGYVISLQDQGGDDEKDSDADTISGKTACTTLEAGEADLNWDAGLHEPTPEPPAALGDYVWHDKNGDGVQGDDEPGVDGVKVYLYDCDGNYLDETLTAGGGKYAFTDMPAGSYQVVFGLPDGYLFTGKDQGGNDADDSDADVTGTTPCVTLAPGETNNTIDAGLLSVGVAIQKYVKEICKPSGGEGLTPGYWKQCQHFDDWYTYTQYQKYNTVFGLTSAQDDPCLTLLGALGRGGGGKAALGRHAVAALLNAANPNIEYAYTVEQIIAMVKEAYRTRDYDKAKNLFEIENEKGADLTPGSGPVVTPPAGFGDDADEAPGPTFVVGAQVRFTFVVTNPGQVPLQVSLIDDNQTPDDTADDFHPTPTLGADNVHNVGDQNADGLLDPGEEWVYTAVGSVTAGPHTNTATVSGTPVGQAWTVTSSDPANYVGKSDCPPPPPPPSCVGKGSTATIGFWQNKNGQALIKSLNGGPCARNLGTWLALQFPNLFGSLKCKTNSEVAAYFESLFKCQGTKLKAQTLAVALAVYVTDASKAGGNYAAKYGFKVSPSGGTGTLCYNVGANGLIIGLTNNATYTVLELLKKADALKAFCASSAIQNAFNTIFDGINQAGDIE